jgi:hypothetical protein
MKLRRLIQKLPVEERPRRRGDRIDCNFCCTAYVALWHEAAVRRGQNHVRFLGYSGRETLAARLSHFDPIADLIASGYGGAILVMN